MSKVLYLISLLLVILVCFLSIITPPSPLPFEYLFYGLIILISSLIRVFSNAKNKKWWDLISLFTFLFFSLFVVQIMPPMVMLFVQFSYFSKIAISIVGIISAVLFVKAIFNWQNKETLKSGISENLIVFVITIFSILGTFFGFWVYGNTIVINDLKINERIYLYGYGKYTSQIVESAFEAAKIITQDQVQDSEIIGNQVVQKTAIEYLGKNPDMSDEYRKRLESAVFDQPINGIAAESQIRLMIKLNPRRAIPLMESNAQDADFNTKLTIITLFNGLIRENPDMVEDACYAGKKVYDMASNGADESRLLSLDVYSRGGLFKENCSSYFN